jgi:fatty-acyl-CoA synthase
MLEGLMQHDHPLTMQHILGRARTMNGHREVVTLTEDGPVRATYAEVGERADRLCSALRALGIEQGDRVGTFAWNTQRHLEAYLGVPAMGAVLHTLNIRLFPEQLAYVVNHASDRVILVDDSLVPLLARVLDELEGVEHFIVMGDGDAGDLPNVLRYEELLAEQGDGYDYPALDDRAAASLCYTSGTTGNPKGVLYSHRSLLLHAVGLSMADAIGVSARDRVLPVVPMFHANAWGLAQAAPLAGADLIMPGRFLQAEPLANAIESERVTIAGAVPTIWLDLLRHLNAHPADLSSLHTVICGGSAVPRALMEGFDAHGVTIVQAWGMTETSPLGSVARPPSEAEGEERWSYRTSAGKLIPLLEARLIGGAEDEEVPWDGESTGELEIRGPWIASTYYADDSAPEKFHDGWLRTGDIAAITPDGYIRISDRTKDVIKSGGEWISSVELENELMAHPAASRRSLLNEAAALRQTPAAGRCSVSSQRRKAHPGAVAPPVRYGSWTPAGFADRSYSPAPDPAGIGSQPERRA